MTANVSVSYGGQKLECVIQNVEETASNSENVTNVQILDAQDGENVETTLRTVGDLRQKVVDHFNLEPEKLKLIHRGNYFEIILLNHRNRAIPSSGRLVIVTLSFSCHFCFEYVNPLSSLTAYHSFTICSYLISGKLIGTNLEEKLSGLRFKDKDVVAAMGGQKRTDPGFAALCAFEREKLIKLNNTFEENGKDLDLLEKNFLQGEITIDYFEV